MMINATRPNHGAANAPNTIPVNPPITVAEVLLRLPWLAEKNRFTFADLARHWETTLPAARMRIYRAIHSAGASISICSDGGRSRFMLASDLIEAYSLGLLGKL